MNNEDFESVIDKRIEYLKRVLSSKGMEYASQEDRLQNFKDGGILNNETPEEYLFELASKHIIALRDFVKDIKNRIGGDFSVQRKYHFWEEKIGDIINYMILLDGLLADRGITREEI